MNSSFLALGQLLLGVLAAIQLLLLLARFGLPRDTVRSLAYLISASLAAILLVEGVSVFGVFPIFYYPSIYGILLGVLAFSLPAFTYLAIVDHPGQIQRKIMWRLPIIGGLMGHWLHGNIMVFVFVAGFIASAGLLLSVASLHRYALRLLAGQLILALLTHFFWTQDLWWAGQLILAWWILQFNGFLNAYLVKNLARAFVPEVPAGAQT